jgi:hypothetical protein
MTETVGESRDGPGAGDHDVTYVFGSHLTTGDCHPFTTMAFSRLLVLRSKIQEGLKGGGDMHSDLVTPQGVPQADDPSTFSPEDAG